VTQKKARTSAEDIRQALAARIINRDLAPGTPLDEHALARDFAVSRTPIREALRLLAASGLVDQRPHATALVAKPDAEMLAGMFDVMGYLEALCAGLCATRMSAQERRDLNALHMRMEAIVHAGEAAAYADANHQFHDAVYAGAHNGYLAEVSRATRQRLQPFRRAQFDAPGRLAKSHREHGLIVEAILRGARTEAELAMREHIAIVEDAWQHLAQEGEDQPLAALSAR
jgi:DNA-binding GntR family transcriptional regulator